MLNIEQPYFYFYRGFCPKSTSMLIYALGMLVEAGIMFRVSALFARSKTLSRSSLKSVLGLLASAGFLVSVFPNDLYHTLHSIGVGLVLGSLYFFTMIFHLELKDDISMTVFVFNIALLQVAVFSYATAFFLNTDAKLSLQKFCLLGVVFTLDRVVTLTDEAYSSVEFLSFFNRFQQ
jgi:hypothetical protein